MMVTSRHVTRRQFLGVTAASGVAASVGRLAVAAEAKKPIRKTILSFYCDDTGPSRGAKAFATFLDYCAQHGITGESSCILGAGGRSIAHSPTDDEHKYLEQIARAYGCGIDTHMEVMTHRGLFDFRGNREPDDVQHEGVWLHEPAVTVEQYERYLGSIIAEGQRVGVRFTGLTWPGCGCPVCTHRYAELRVAGHTAPNPNLWKALLNLAKAGKFRGSTVPCFFESSETNYGLHLKAQDGKLGVYDLMPNALDKFGIWENNPARVDADYYISADGKSGIIVRRVEAGEPYCLWYSHWQGLNPANGVGWRAFTTVIDRITKHLHGRIVWMRPSEITRRYHAAGGWDFLDKL